MIRSFGHWLLIGLIVVSTLVGSVAKLGSTAAASAQEPQFSAAAATPWEQGGVLGKVYLSGLPLHCYQYSTPSKFVGIHQYDYPLIAVTSQPGVTSQKVEVKADLLQIDPRGSYKFLARSPGVVYANVSNTPVAVKPIVQSFGAYYPGPDYVVSFLIQWYAPDGVTVTGQAAYVYSNYRVTVDNVFVRDDAPVCGSYWKPTVTTSATAGTVNSTLTYSLALYPLEVPVSIKWDGASIGSVTTTNEGTATSKLAIPAAPMGTHKLTFSTGHWNATANFTVTPRIKLIPSTGLKRGQTVNVSLRGYAKYETVRIRWKKGTSWVELARVTTSGTGSANVNIKVPTFAADGYNSVRGDGSYGHAQTNAVSVVVSASSSAKASPTPTKTPTPAPTAIPATATPIASPSPIVEVSTPGVTATPTVTETVTPEPSPEETETPPPGTETPMPEPGADATAEPSLGASIPDEEEG